MGDNPKAPIILFWFRQRWSEILNALNVMGSGGALAEGNAYGSGTANALINTANEIFYASGEDFFATNPFFLNHLMYDAFTAYPKLLGEAGDPYLTPGNIVIEGAEVGGDDVRGPSWHTNLLRANGLPLARHFPQTEASSVWEWVFRGPNPEPVSEPWIELYSYYPKPALHKPQRLSWFDPGMGFVYVRSDWDSEGATHISSWAGPQLDIHEHLDKGGFTIFKGNELTGSTGNYDFSTTPTAHGINYYGRTVSANSILVGDPLEQFGGFVGFAGCDTLGNHTTFPVDNGSKSVCPANDGGQRTVSPLSMSPDSFTTYQYNAASYNTARVTSFSDNGTAVTWVEDISNAYSNASYAMPGSRAKVSSVIRKKVYLRDLDLMLVGDIVSSADPSFEKSVVIHSPDQLIIGGSTSVIAPGEEIHTGTTDSKIVVDNSQPSNTGQIAVDYRSGYSALLIRTLFPVNPVLRRVGGRDPSPVPHPLDGQSNRQIPAPYHLHTHTRDFWVHDYSEGFLPDHASSNWPPAFPPEMNYTMYIPSVVGGFGRWRMQIQPSAPATTDYFLNVFKPTQDANATLPVMNSIDQPGAFGVTIFGNGHAYTVMFSRADSSAPTLTVN